MEFIPKGYEELLPIALQSETITEYLTLRDLGCNDEDVIEWIQLQRAISTTDSINQKIRDGTTGS